MQELLNSRPDPPDMGSRGYVNFMRRASEMLTAPVTPTEDVVRAWQTLVDTMARVFDVPAGLIMRLSGHEIEVFVSSGTE